MIYLLFLAKTVPLYNLLARKLTKSHFISQHGNSRTSTISMFPASTNPSICCYMVIMLLFILSGGDDLMLAQCCTSVHGSHGSLNTGKSLN